MGGGGEELAGELGWEGHGEAGVDDCELYNGERQMLKVVRAATID